MQHEMDAVVKPTILVADDTPDNLMLMMASLKDEYTVKLVSGGVLALKLPAMTPLRGRLSLRLQCLTGHRRPTPGSKQPEKTMGMATGGGKPATPAAAQGRVMLFAAVYGALARKFFAGLSQGAAGALTKLLPERRPTC